MNDNLCPKCQKFRTIGCEICSECQEQAKQEADLAARFAVALAGGAAGKGGLPHPESRWAGADEIWEFATLLAKRRPKP